ncbi:HTH-type transcriptional regulator BetI [Pseudovibrio axinellae]|uniref:HTH-type transcriptional regulator BetI n=1 Tax=Pseudovibrio axinellae TaxID=989403 RepID=A0A165Z5G6_9HYPH|nr:transcriptional regulator BetI [Pseudovibrio axinellae]KZL19526.1 HTH-type transcriptional regulator BetI [Pseudovibrio axinellae]SEQ30496.1 transcriptional regulator, TetR family [Pseudovibrio axinellae]
MPKVGMEEERKNSIIMGTIKAIHEKGYAATTMADIAKNAVVSTGLPHHYFGSKAAVFNATMSYLLKDLSKQSRKRLLKAKSPVERIDAIIHTNFSNEQFQPSIISAWFAFYVVARIEPETRRLLQIYHRRLISNLTAEYHRLTDRDAAIAAAEGTAAMIDGLWLQCVLTTSHSDGAPATILVQDYVQKCLKSFNAPETP